MTITVIGNSNGTITISCRGETTTIGGTLSPDPAPQPVNASGKTPVLWPNDQHTASIVATGKAKTEIISVDSVDDLESVMRKTYDLHVKKAKPTIFQFNVKSGKALRIGNINKVVSDLGEPEWMGMQINLLGPNDE